MVKNTLICNALFTQRNVTLRRCLKFSWLPHVLRSVADKNYRVSVKRANSRTEKCPIDFCRTQRKWLPRVFCILAEKGQKMRYLKGSISNKMRGRRTNIRQPRGLPDMNSWMSSNRFSQYNTPSGNVIMEGCDVQKHLQHYVADRFQTSCCYCLAKLARLKARRF